MQISSVDEVADLDLLFVKNGQSTLRASAGDVLAVYDPQLRALRAPHPGLAGRTYALPLTYVR
jgi:hypothetical protein